MAVAVTSKPETNTGSSGAASLASASLAGAVYVLACLAIVGGGVPYLWSQGVAGWMTEHLGSFVNTAGLFIVELFAIGVLGYVGLMMVGGTPRPGLKAGIATAVAFVVAFALLVTGTGQLFASTIGDAIAAIVGAGIIYAGMRFFQDRRFDDRMHAFEKQGWFTAATYKPNQGRKVRRATLLGLLLIIGCGIYTLVNHGTLDTVGRNWIFRVPFAGIAVTLLPDVRFTMPLLLAGLAFWLSYRLVHSPTFAEFLIATEGELNKIAWPNRKSLWQDTIVVLTTVVLMTLFLFVVDVAWGRILSHPWIGVLKLDSGKGEQNQVQEIKELDW